MDKISANINDFQPLDKYKAIVSGQEMSADWLRGFIPGNAKLSYCPPASEVKVHVTKKELKSMLDGEVVELSYGRINEILDHYQSLFVKVFGTDFLWNVLVDTPLTTEETGDKRFPKSYFLELELSFGDKTEKEGEKLIHALVDAIRFCLSPSIIFQDKKGDFLSTSLHTGTEYGLYDTGARLRINLCETMVNVLFKADCDA